MRRRRFVWSRTEDTARHIGTALIVTALVGFFFEPAITYIDVGVAIGLGITLLVYGWTEEHK